MIRNALRAVTAAACLFVVTATSASAHVKWFLGKSEAEILKTAKPDLFAHASIANSIPAAITFLIVALSIVAAREFVHLAPHRILSKLGEKAEPLLNLFMGVCAGSFLLYCAFNKFLLTPNLIICPHCPQWLPFAQGLVGACLMLGLFSRISGVALLFLILYSFNKHQLGDSLDLFPLFGLAIYFIAVGRNKYSLDASMMFDRLPSSNAVDFAQLQLRWFLGVGLMILAVDEKLMHPQFALALLNRVPSLNFVGAATMSNDMFVLSAGLAELAIGAIIAIGSFPRTAVAMLLTVFFATTLFFGARELWGHLPFYGMIASILLRGSGPVPDELVLRETAARLVRPTKVYTTKRLA